MASFAAISLLPRPLASICKISLSRGVSGSASSSSSRERAGKANPLAWTCAETCVQGFVVQTALEVFKIGEAPGDFHVAGRQQVFQAGALERGSRDNENGDHAATELLAGSGFPSCTVTRRIRS